MPHLHLSVQHGDDMILKRMKRRHLARDVVRFCDEARRLRPDILFGADIISGFPTEDEAAHQKTLELLERCHIPHLHVFGYSPREGTPAAKMKQLSGDIIKQRSKQVRELGAHLLHTSLDNLIGSQDQMLVEMGNQGHLRNFAKAVVTGPILSSGTIISVKVTGRDGDNVLVESVA